MVRLSNGTIIPANPDEIEKLQQKKKDQIKNETKENNERVKQIRLKPRKIIKLFFFICFNSTIFSSNY